MIRDLIKVKDKVAYILENHPHTRDCDKSLWLAYLVFFHDAQNVVNHSNDPWYSFRDLIKSTDTPTMESVRRVRQKYQEDGQYIGKKRALKMREAENVRQWAQQS